jgi:hypothetical protein
MMMDPSFILGFNGGFPHHQVVNAGTSESLGKAVLSLPDLCTGGIMVELRGPPWDASD